MTVQQKRGEKGEKEAAFYLRKKGFKILEKNYRAGRSEIDLICEHKKILVFVEVKARTSVRYGNPEEFVNAAKAAKVMEGAEAYIIEKNWKGAIRFDIVSVLLLKNKIEIKHFKDAFY